MSFSSGVKEELALVNSPARHCAIALIAALFHLCPVLEKERAGIRTENPYAAAAFEAALRRVRLENIEVEKSGREMIVQIAGKQQVTRFLAMLKLDHAVCMEDAGSGQCAQQVVSRTVSPVLLQKTCCRKTFLRGLFLVAGSVSDPSGSYHLEIAPPGPEDADSILKLLSSIGFQAKCTRRKGRSVVYLKDGEQISDFLGSIGATQSLMKLENARILKDIAGNINRQVNFEAANLKKTGIASNRQLEDIELIERTIGVHSLSESLQQTARLRVENPAGSLQELADASNPPVGRSGINHRLQRLAGIAAKIREKEGHS